jgi:DNA-binding phage protein
VAKAKVKLEPYDAAEFLDTAEDVEAYIGEALRSGDKRRIDLALETIKRVSARFTKRSVTANHAHT